MAIFAVSKPRARCSYIHIFTKSTDHHKSPLGPMHGIRVTKVPLANVSVKEFFLLKTKTFYVLWITSVSYLTCVTAFKLRWHLSNTMGTLDGEKAWKQWNLGNRFHNPTTRRQVHSLGLCKRRYSVRLLMMHSRTFSLVLSFCIPPTDWHDLKSTYV